MAFTDEENPLGGLRVRWAGETVALLSLPALARLVAPRPRAAGTHAMQAFRAAHPGVTAIAAFDDDVALRTLTALHDLALDAPADLPHAPGHAIVRDSA